MPSSEAAAAVETSTETELELAGDDREYRNGFDDEDIAAVDPASDPDDPADIELDEELDPEGDEPDEDEDAPDADAAQVQKEAPAQADAAAKPDGDAAPSANADPPPTDPNAAPAGEAPKPERLTLKFDGKSLEIPDSIVFEADTPEGKRKLVVFPLEHVNRVLAPHLADRSVWRNEKRELITRATKAEAAIENHEDILKAREVLKLFDELITAPDDERLSRLDTFRDQRPVWEEKQKALSLQKQLEAVGKIEEPVDEVLQRLDAEELQEGLQKTLQTELESLSKSEELAGLIDPGDERLFADLWDVYPNIFFRASEDIVQNGRVIIPRGEIGVDRKYLRTFLGRRAEQLKDIRDRALRAKEVEKQNEQVLNGAKKQPDEKPAVRTKPKNRPAKARIPKGEEDYYADPDEWKDNFLKDVRGASVEY